MQSLINSKNINFKQKRKIIKAGYESIYLVEINILNDTECVLKITGSTLNIYTITLKNNKLKCNCQDSFNCFINNLYCKHLCFVLIKPEIVTTVLCVKSRPHSISPAARATPPFFRCHS